MIPVDHSLQSAHETTDVPNALVGSFDRGEEAPVYHWLLSQSSESLPYYLDYLCEKEWRFGQRYKTLNPVRPQTLANMCQFLEINHMRAPGK